MKTRRPCHAPVNRALLFPFNMQIESTKPPEAEASRRGLGGRSRCAARRGGKMRYRYFIVWDRRIYWPFCL
jgi:hypothetical protein